MISKTVPGFSSVSHGVRCDDGCQLMVSWQLRDSAVPGHVLAYRGKF